MKLLLIGHTERYPVEQLQMQLFPDEPSEFVTHRFTGDGTVSSLSRGKKYLTATAKVEKDGKTGFASRRIPLENADVRMTRRILQQSYYLAATKVLGTVPSEAKVVVEGINMVTCHIKPRKQGEEGGIVKREAAIYASKVQVVCPKCDKGTRVAYEIKDGKKVRVCKHCGAAL